MAAQFGFPSVVAINSNVIIPTAPNQVLTTLNVPTGTTPFGVQRPAPIYYYQFHRRNPILVHAPHWATNRLDSRNDAWAQILWDVRYPWTVLANNMQRMLLVRHSPAGVIQNLATLDFQVYNHIVYNLCRFQHTAFAFNTMRDLYFFLIHTKRRNAYKHVRNIEILNFTDGTYVHQAVQLLNKCESLRRLHLHHCRRCREIRCPPNVWRALKRLRAPSSLRTSAAANPMRLRFTERENTLLDFCRKCRAMGAAAHNTNGSPSTVFQWNDYLNRMNRLRRSILR